VIARAGFAVAGAARGPRGRGLVATAVAVVPVASAEGSACAETLAEAGAEVACAMAEVDRSEGCEGCEASAATGPVDRDQAQRAPMPPSVASGKRTARAFVAT
jgi:hypothetical protein